MDGDFTKFFLFVVLALAVLVLVTDQRRPLANAPLDSDTPTDRSTDPTDPGLVTSAQFANVPSNMVQVPPLSLCMPTAGVQPYGDSDG